MAKPLVSNVLWAAVEPLLPVEPLKPKGGRPRVDTPAHNAHIQSAEVCGSCHTVHLPVLSKGKVIGHTYEQTTYAEWAFSDYRTGATPDGPLPMGPGAKAETCQGCHMPSKDAQGQPIRSKIASIQEHSNFPEADNTLAPDDIDLEVREGFASHVLVGLNTFLIKMAQQFPDIMGIRTQDPMLTRKGLDPLLYTEQAIAHQAETKTADIQVSNLTMNEAAIEAARRSHEAEPSNCYGGGDGAAHRRSAHG